MKNQLKQQTPQAIIEVTIGREYTKPKLHPPKFTDATQPMQPFGKLGEILRGKN